ncbi:hypothetical protein L1887_59211 [Cichorium endivia]|nr:hypothetical protein L1887_59211 [Cichorium endivia]
MHAKRWMVDGGAVWRSGLCKCREAGGRAGEWSGGGRGRGSSSVSRAASCSADDAERELRGGEWVCQATSASVAVSPCYRSLQLLNALFALRLADTRREKMPHPIEP